LARCVPNLYQRFTQLSKNNNTLSIRTDDTQIFASTHDFVELANDINSDLENVTDWLNVKELQSHPSKAKLIVIGSKQNLTNKVGDSYNSIIMNNNVVSSVVSNKCLRVDLDDRLTFDINKQEDLFSIGALRRIKPFVPQSYSSHVTLYKSLIQPYFDHCFPLWNTCDKMLKDKLQILYKIVRLELSLEQDMMIGLDHVIFGRFRMG
jgi:hypothetical protein